MSRGENILLAGLAALLLYSSYRGIKANSMPHEVQNAYEMKVALGEAYDSNTAARFSEALKTSIDGKSMPDLLEEYSMHRKAQDYGFYYIMAICPPLFIAYTNTADGNLFK